MRKKHHSFQSRVWGRVQLQQNKLHAMEIQALKYIYHYILNIKKGHKFHSLLILYSKNVQ
jgi:hypothetical protein